MAKRKSKSEPSGRKKKSVPKKPLSKEPSTADTIPFETALAQLKEVVSELETGNLTLSQSLEQYEQGVKNLKSCYQSLESAQKKIELLVRLDQDGNLITQPFDDTATSQPTRKTTRQSQIHDPTEVDDDDLSGEDEFDDEDGDIDDANRLF